MFTFRKKKKNQKSERNLSTEQSRLKVWLLNCSCDSEHDLFLFFLKYSLLLAGLLLVRTQANTHTSYQNWMLFINRLSVLWVRLWDSKDLLGSNIRCKHVVLLCCKLSRRSAHCSHMHIVPPVSYSSWIPHVGILIIWGELREGGRRGDGERVQRERVTQKQQGESVRIKVWWSDD